MSKDKQLAKAKESFHKALDLIQKKERDKARVELEAALKCDEAFSITLFEDQIDEYSELNKLSDAILLADVLSQFRKKDFVLANRLGNFYRRLDNVKQANLLYKRAISINKKFETAYLNLAASMAKTSLYDDEIKHFIETHIDFNRFFLPQSTYPRDKKIIAHLTDVMNKKYLVSRVDRIQELILKKALTQQKTDFDQVDDLINKLKTKIGSVERFKGDNIDIIELLGEAMNQDWSQLASSEKDRFLWNVLNLGLYILNHYSNEGSMLPGYSFRGKPGKDLQLAIDAITKLKLEQYPYRYIDMIIALCHFQSGSTDEGINELKAMLKQDPNDRYLNINLGLLNYRLGNKLLSYIYLLKGTSLVEELGGARHLSEIVCLAEEKLQEGDLKQALKLYRIASLETDNSELLMNIGHILISLHRYDQAIQPFKSVLRQNPDSEMAQHKLKEIQGHLCFIADEFFEKREFVKAAEFYEKTLVIDRTPRILKKAAEAYKMQGDLKKEHELQSEYQIKVTEEKEVGRQTMKKRHVVHGLQCMKEKEYQKAIHHFHEAFSLKPDKDTFLYLSFLYKKFNQKIALKELVKRWQQEKQRLNRQTL